MSKFRVVALSNGKLAMHSGEAKSRRLADELAATLIRHYQGGPFDWKAYDEVQVQELKDGTWQTVDRTAV